MTNTAETQVQEEKKKRHPVLVEQLTVMGKQNPEEDEYDENELYDHVGKQFKDKDEKLSQYDQAFSAYQERIGSDPLIMAINQELEKGASLLQAISMHVAPEDLLPMEGDPDYEQFAQANEQRKAKYKEKQDFEAMLEANRAKIDQSIDELIAEQELSEEEGAALILDIDKLINSILIYDIPKDQLKTFYKGKTADAEIAAAEAAAETRGRNAQIEVKKTKVTDGMPGTEGSDTPIVEKKKSWAEWVNKS